VGKQSESLNLSIGKIQNLGQSFNTTFFANISKVNLEKSKTLFMFSEFILPLQISLGIAPLSRPQNTLIQWKNIRSFVQGGQITRPEKLRWQLPNSFFLTYWNAC